MPEVVACGEALIAVTPQVRGRLDETMDIKLHVAGAESNVAIGLSRLGVSTAFWGAVGTDPFGSIIRTRLAAEGVDVTHLLQRPEPTGLMFKEWYGLGEDPQVYYYRAGSAGSAWDCGANITNDLREVRWIHCSGITAMIGLASRRSIQAIIMAAKPLGIAISLDVNLRTKLAPAAEWRQVLDALIPYSDVVFCTTRELSQLWAIQDPMDWFAPESKREQSVLVVKDDAHQVSAYNASGPIARAHPWSVTKVVDPVGAGDGLAAGIIAARLKEWEWRDALRLGTLVGALAVSHPGDFEGYPYWREVEALWEDRWIDR